MTTKITKWILGKTSFATLIFMALSAGASLSAQTDLMRSDKAHANDLQKGTIQYVGWAIQIRIAIRCQQ